MTQLKKDNGSPVRTLVCCLGSTAVAAMVLVLASCRGDKGTPGEGPGAVSVLRFSAIPDVNTTAQAERFKAVAKYLAEALEVQVEFVPSTTYGASVEKFENRDIELAWFGGVAGVQARRAVDGARALAAGKKDLAFQSYFVANAATGLTRSEEFPKALADLTFTFGSSGSTSGCIMPSHFIMERTGMSPMEFFRKKPLGFSGAHDKTALQVQDGTFQAGVLNYATYENMVKEGRVDPAQCVVIWETPPFADYNFTAHPGLEKTFGKGFLEKLQKALLECRDPAALQSLGRTELVEVTNETFAPVARVLEKGEV